MGMNFNDSMTTRKLSEQAWKITAVSQLKWGLLGVEKFPINVSLGFPGGSVVKRLPDK